MDEEGFLILNASQVVHSRTYDQESLKNLNPKEVFSWLYKDGEKSPSLSNHTLKIEVYSSLTLEKLLCRYIHLEDYENSNIPKVCLEIMMGHDIKIVLPSSHFLDNSEF